MANAAASETEAQVPAPVSKPATAPAPEKFVEYIGPATRRILTVEDWKRVGADDMDKVVEFGFANQRKVALSEFTAKAIAYLKIDDRFEVPS